MSTATVEQTGVLSAQTEASVVPDAEILRLRISDTEHRVSVVPLEVRKVADDVDEVVSTGRTIGYIRRVPPLFVALEGNRLDLAEECAQSQRWDRAAARLLEEDASHHRAMAARLPGSRRARAAN